MNSKLLLDFALDHLSKQPLESQISIADQIIQDLEFMTQTIKNFRDSAKSQLSFDNALEAIEKEIHH
jgi:phosphopantothenate synthetase